MGYKAKLNSFGESLRFLLCHDQLAILRVLLNAKRRVPDSEDVGGEARHDEIVQVVMQRSASLLKSWVGLDFHFIAVTLWQSDDRARVADVLDQLIRSFAQVQDFPR